MSLPPLTQDFLLTLLGPEDKNPSKAGSKSIKWERGGLYFRAAPGRPPRGTDILYLWASHYPDRTPTFERSSSDFRKVFHRTFEAQWREKFTAAIAEMAARAEKWAAESARYKKEQEEREALEVEAWRKLKEGLFDKSTLPPYTGTLDSLPMFIRLMESGRAASTKLRVTMNGFTFPLDLVVRVKGRGVAFELSTSEYSSLPPPSPEFSSGLFRWLMKHFPVAPKED